MLIANLSFIKQPFLSILLFIKRKEAVMKIEHSSVALFSSHSKHDEVQVVESLKMWDKPKNNPEFAPGQGDRLVLSDLYKSLKHNNTAPKVDGGELDSGIDPKLMNIIYILEMLTGQKIDSSFLRKLHTNTEAGSSSEHAVALDRVMPVGWGIDYNYQRTQIHEESLNFSAQGSVKTGDGKSIEFSLALSMKNSVHVSETLNFRAGDALIDPLVINFGAESVHLSEVKKEFDLNLDGKSDTFNFVGAGSGFLVLDKNSDGIINNGSELFGPTQGNGFEELSAYDSDHNNWIDENDAIFKKLLIWTKDETGKESLYSLKEKDIGAIYLGRANTEFTLNDTTQKMQGVMKESSIFLKESGGVGTIQEVDLRI